MKSKRMMDALVAAPALILLSPALLLIAAIVKWDSPGPAIYFGRRVGQFGRPFYLLKFRTMVLGADRKGPLITGCNDPRVTRIGHFLRRTKLDELPSFWNVLKGDMSLVGPRPENERSAALYNPEQRQVLNLRPGITSLATLKYRNEEALLPPGPGLEDVYFRIMQDKLSLELEYLSRKTLWLDVSILLQTFAALFR